MLRDYRLYLDDILEAIGNIRDYISDMDYPEFCQDRKTRDAVVRNLEVIGEAASRLPDSTRSAAGGIEWRKIIGLRNILAHEYFGISLPVIWDLTQKKLDPLAKACSKLRDNPGNF
jgi:uncharacterized protein with HEPN domain